MQKFVFIILFLLISTSSFSGAGGGGGGNMGGGNMGGGGGNPCPPFSPCWCATHNHPSCVTPVPIDEKIIILISAGLMIGSYSYLHKKKKLIK